MISELWKVIRDLVLFPAMLGLSLFIALVGASQSSSKGINDKISRQEHRVDSLEEEQRKSSALCFEAKDECDSLVEKVRKHDDVLALLQRTTNQNNLSTFTLEIDAKAVCSRELAKCTKEALQLQQKLLGVDK